MWLVVSFSAGEREIFRVGGRRQAGRLRQRSQAGGKQGHQCVILQIVPCCVTVFADLHIERRADPNAKVGELWRLGRGAKIAILAPNTKTGSGHENGHEFAIATKIGDVG